jgi:cyclic pyranopterin phosphate synthase
VAGPADEYSVTSPAGAHTGTLGFITPVSDRFCDTCNRMRLTQDGFLKGCLFGHADVDLLKPMRAGASDDELRALVRRAAAIKEERHPMFVGMSKSALPLHARNMSEIGG